MLAEGTGVFGRFIGLAAGLLGGVWVLAIFLLADGSAVDGLTMSTLRRGRTGAEDKVPTEVVETLRETVDMAVAGLLKLECDMDFLGDPDGSADPGRAGRFLPAFVACF